MNREVPQRPLEYAPAPASRVAGEIPPVREGNCRILVLRLGSMGDVLHTLPAVAALRRAVPYAHIGWVIERRWKCFLAAEGALLAGPRSPARPLVDCVHLVDTFRWRSSPLAPANLRAAATFTRELREAKYDVSIDFQGALKSAFVGKLSGAPQRMGFRRPRELPARWFYTRMIAASGVHIIEQNLSLAAGFGSGVPGCAEFSFPFDGAAERECKAQLSRLGVREFAILNPGAGWGAKRWPAERYAQVARGLARLGLASLVNGGPGEAAMAAEIAARSGSGVFPLVCPVPVLMAIMRRARLFVGGDTGPMHLAAAMGVPVVAIFGPTDPARNGPWKTASVVLRPERAAVSYSHRNRSDGAVRAIGPEQVIEAGERLLSLSGGEIG